MKKIIFLLLFLFSTSYAQDTLNQSLDQSIDTIWSLGTYTPMPSSPESMNKDHFPLIPPSPARKIPGDRTVLIPIEQTDGSLNASPNDAQAYILYNRATIAFQNKDYEQYTLLYRELIRRFPDSSYTPYALYVLSLDETDVRRKIRILLTIKERFPNFPHKVLILDSLGDLYYLLGSYDAAEEVLSQSDSYYAAYLRATISLETQKPNRAITLIREALQKAPDNETAYRVYILYSEALLHLRSYENSITILQKAAELRPWAYDNGVAILLNAGKSFFNSKQYPEALYTFSMLRLRFAGSTEARLADQYISALNNLGAVQMMSVPWIANNFDTILQPQPVKHLTPPQAPSMEDIQEMHNLPRSAVPEPDLDYITAVPPMSLPSQQNTYSVLLPVSNIPSSPISVISVTNTVEQTVTNFIENFLTNRIFVVETNTFTNNLVLRDTLTATNVTTNIVQIMETNSIISYEPVILWRTNYEQINITNLVTNIVDHVVTNERLDLIPLQLTNYNFVNRPQDITNVIYRDITNRYLEYGLDNTTNWIENITTKRFVEIIPSWKTTYNTIDTNELVTNVIREVVTNQRLELVPQWISNIRTNDSYRLVSNIITNTRLRIAPRWITNYQVIQTNMRDVVITNVVSDIQNQMKTNIQDVFITNNLVITNIMNIVQTNSQEIVITNVQDVAQTNVLNVIVTNQIDTIQTNIKDIVITNVQDVAQTNVLNVIVTNQVNTIQTNIKDIVITNTIIDTIQTNRQNVIVTNAQNIVFTNFQNVVLTNYTDMMVTNLQEAIMTNVRDVVQTNIQNVIVTNAVINTIQTNFQEAIVTNIRDVIQTNTQNVIVTNARPSIYTNIHNNIITNIGQRIYTNSYNHNSYTPGSIQYAPVDMTAMDDSSLIDSEDQVAFIEEPIYAAPVQEEQLKLVSQQVMRLENLASRIAEKSAGIAGNYGFSDNKGYVIRIAEVKDLSVANIVLKDIEKLNLGIQAGIYYRDSRYFVEMRAIKDKELAESIFQQLYQLGYKDVQIFEQYEVVEYHEE